MFILLQDRLLLGSGRLLPSSMPMLNGSSQVLLAPDQLLSDQPALLFAGIFVQIFTGWMLTPSGGCCSAGG